MFEDEIIFGQSEIADPEKWEPWRREMSKSAELKYKYNLPREVFDYLEELENVEQQKAELLEYLKYLYTSQLIKSQRMTDILNKYK